MIALLFAAASATACVAAAPWMDQAALGTWNVAGFPLQAPAKGGPSPNPEHARPPADGPERALAKLGWLIMGPATHAGRLTIVRASSSGGDLHFMEAYQLFAFYDGKYAGTLAPVPMTSSTDGALGGVFDVKERIFRAAFARYTPQDPLCCPSRETDVTYRVDLTPKGPLVVPTARKTKPTAK